MAGGPAVVVSDGVAVGGAVGSVLVKVPPSSTAGPLGGDLLTTGASETGGADGDATTGTPTGLATPGGAVPPPPALLGMVGETVGVVGLP